ncbi:MAG: hypothetical protein AAGK47_01095 [Bacteroidota bacterium]
MPTGEWAGTLTETGESSAFTYRISLQTNDNTITGTSVSIATDVQQARFRLVGNWDGTWLYLQEVEQTSPPPEWCLKQLRLRYVDAHQQILQGSWQATDCVPGEVMLHRQVPTTPVVNNTIAVAPPPSPQRNYLTIEEQQLATEQAILGKWTGHLGQSDRDYGFYYEIDLQAEHAASRSFIVSEDNGGSATHQLRWQYDDQAETISLQEPLIATKTDPNWAWCLKNAQLQLHKKANKYVLTGKWGGYLEGHTPSGTKGKCAPGSIYLEKPILRNREVATVVQSHTTTSVPIANTPDGSADNTAIAVRAQGRSIKVARTIQVQNSKIRIKVWDNGTVDGDVVTIFLNEERVAHQLRVTKTKRTFPITLATESNFLIMHANDLGAIAPNTVALSIDDGIKEQRLIISSDLAESGAVLIKEIRQ